MKPATVLLVGGVVFLAYQLMSKKMDMDAAAAPVQSPSTPPPPQDTHTGPGDLFGQIADVFRGATKVISQVTQQNT